MINIYCSQDTTKLLNVDSGQDYLIPFPEDGKHPQVMQRYVLGLLESIKTNDITIITHSREVINTVINYVEDRETWDNHDCVVTFLGEDGSINPSTLDQGYCLLDWSIGCMSIN